ncbi:MAG: hypothetical protein QOF60_210 [Actinomycetota bacterium]|nr:hypothetical protein [Actinomycetota bacterium]
MDEAGSGMVELAVCILVLGMLLPVLVAVVRSPAQAARVSYAVRAATEDAARARNPLEAQQAAAAEIETNLVGPGNPPVCAEHSFAVDASALRAELDEDATLTPGHVEVVLSCTVDGRRMAGLPFDVRRTFDVRRRHMTDSYRRTG